MKTTISNLLTQKRRLIATLLIIALILGVIWYFTSGPSTREGLVSSEDILVSGTQGGVVYGSNEEYFFVLFPEEYFKLPKKSPCKGSSPNDHTTWCNEWSTPNQY